MHKFVPNNFKECDLDLKIAEIQRTFTSHIDMYLGVAYTRCTSCLVTHTAILMNFISTF
jgi:hypothetical protein